MNDKEFPAKIANLYLSDDAANHELADTILLGQCANYNDKQKRKLAYQICEFYYKSPEFLQFVKDAPNLAKAKIEKLKNSKLGISAPIYLQGLFWEKDSFLKVFLRLDFLGFDSFLIDTVENELVAGDADKKIIDFMLKCLEDNQFYIDVCAVEARAQLYPNFDIDNFIKQKAKIFYNHIDCLPFYAN